MKKCVTIIKVKPLNTNVLLDSNCQNKAVLSILKLSSGLNCVSMSCKKFFCDLESDWVSIAPALPCTD